MCCHKLGCTQLSRITLYSKTLRLPFSSITRPIPNQVQLDNVHVHKVTSMKTWDPKADASVQLQ